METKIDTLKTHAKRSEFARSLYHRQTMKRNAVIAVTAYGIRRSK